MLVDVPFGLTTLAGDGVPCNSVQCVGLRENSPVSPHTCHEANLPVTGSYGSVPSVRTGRYVRSTVPTVSNYECSVVLVTL